MKTSSRHKLKLTFDAVFYYVTDMETSIAFYRDTLGLHMASRDFVARFDVDGVLLELVPMPPGSVVPGNGNARLCLAVGDMNETVAQLRSVGIQTSNIKDKKGGRIAFFRDPDGNELSLWQYEKAYDRRVTVNSVALPG
jgi:catechol 2,3-dioxygenase-like lactoylglutathione lyase family enzyme